MLAGNVQEGGRKSSQPEQRWMLSGSVQAGGSKISQPVQRWMLDGSVHAGSSMGNQEEGKSKGWLNNEEAGPQECALGKELMESEEMMEKMFGSRFKIVERAGIQLLKIISKTNQWFGSYCMMMSSQPAWRMLGACQYLNSQPVGRMMLVGSVQAGGGLSSQPTCMMMMTCLSQNSLWIDRMMLAGGAQAGGRMSSQFARRMMMTSQTLNIQPVNRWILAGSTGRMSSQPVKR
jgi:hypothetical protein